MRDEGSNNIAAAQGGGSGVNRVFNIAAAQSGGSGVNREAPQGGLIGLIGKLYGLCCFGGSFFYFLGQLMYICYVPSCI